MFWIFVRIASVKYPRHMFFQEIRAEQDLSYTSICPLSILYNSKFILMATFLGTNDVVVTRVHMSMLNRLGRQIIYRLRQAKSAFKHVHNAKIMITMHLLKVPAAPCSPFIYFVVSNDSVSVQWRPWSDWASSGSSLSAHDLRTHFRLVGFIFSYFSVWKKGRMFSVPVVPYAPSEHMVFIQRRLNVDATSWRCINVLCQLG